MSPETRAVARIIEDIQDRGGLGDEWNIIDLDIREEIVEEWKRIIHAAIEESK